MGFVAPRVAKIHFAMLNNRVEPICNVDGSIRALAHINRPKRRVIGLNQFRLLLRDITSAIGFEGESANSVAAEIVGDKGLLPIFWEMPARKDFETAMLRATRVQTLNHTLGTNSGCVVGTGDNIINTFATRTIGCKRLAPLIKMMSPAIDQTTHGDFEFKIFRTKLPDASATQTLGPVWSF